MFKGQVSRPHNKTGTHLLYNNIVAKRLKISSNFVLSLVALPLWFSNAVFMAVKF